MGDLYRRLKAAREATNSQERPREGSPPASSPGSPATSAESPSNTSASQQAEGNGESQERPPPEGFEPKAGVFLRREQISVEELQGGQSLPGPESPVSTPLRLLAGPAEGERMMESHLFFDLEATGLSTGAGNVAFLLGLGRRSRESFELTQWLLPDYPWEPELLRSVAEELERLEEELGPLTLVSYNGRSFDTPLLRTRMLMNGIPFEPPRELDLLPLTRRLWRRSLENCSLGTVEDGVLGVIRELDVPGAFVPLRYFDYLQSGRPEPLLEVVAHHRQDILSLYLLLSRIESILAGGDSNGTGGDSSGTAGAVDTFELAKLLLELDPLPGAAERGEALFRGLTEEGKNERGALYYGRYLRRQGKPRAAYEIWRRCFAVAGSIASGIMAAKLLEHEFRDFRGALDLVEELLERSLPTQERLRSTLLHRQERLRRRIASS